MAGVPKENRSELNMSLLASQSGQEVHYDASLGEGQESDASSASGHRREHRDHHPPARGHEKGFKKKIKEIDHQIREAWKAGNHEKSRELHRRKEALEEAHKSGDSANGGMYMAMNQDDLSADDADGGAVGVKVTKGGGATTTKGGGDRGDTKVLTMDSGATENHKGGGDFIKSIIFGGLDGIITTFAVVSAVQGADIKQAVVLAMGFSNLVADGISMGVGDFTSEKAEIDFTRNERKREKWEFDNYRAGEIAEMIEIYQEKGITREDAREILTRMAKYEDFFIDHMMVQELELFPPDDDANPMMNGLVTMGSFMFFGMVPLFSYIILDGVDVGALDARSAKFGLSIILTLITLGVLGLFQARITDAPRIKTIAFVVGNGALAAGAAYLIAYLISLIVDVAEGEGACD